MKLEMKRKRKFRSKGLKLEEKNEINSKGRETKEETIQE
jgi:hypothetical protein